MKNCPKSVEFDRKYTGSNPLLSQPIPVRGVVGLTIDRCIMIVKFNVCHLDYKHGFLSIEYSTANLKSC